jgi:hypothetical protein
MNQMTQLVRAAQTYCSMLQLKEVEVMPILTFQSPQILVVVMLHGSFVYNNRNRVIYASHGNGQKRANHNHHQPLYYAPRIHPAAPNGTATRSLRSTRCLFRPSLISPPTPKAQQRLATHSLLYLELIIAFAERRCSWCFRFAF